MNKSNLLSPTDLKAISAMIQREIDLHKDLNLNPNEKYLEYLDGLKKRVDNVKSMMDNFLETGEFFV